VILAGVVAINGITEVEVAQSMAGEAMAVRKRGHVRQMTATGAFRVLNSVATHMGGGVGEIRPF